MKNLDAIADEIYELEKQCQENRVISLDYYLNRIEELTKDLTIAEADAIDEILIQKLSNHREKGEL